jgi:hypothetical protein
MIPISVLDGKKVLAWDRHVYSVALGIAILMLIVSMIYV